MRSPFFFLFIKHLRHRLRPPVHVLSHSLCLASCVSRLLTIKNKSILAKKKKHETKQKMATTTTLVSKKKKKIKLESNQTKTKESPDRHVEWYTARQPIRLGDFQLSQPQSLALTLGDGRDDDSVPKDTKAH